jgi:ATP synthase protein I
MTTESKQDTRRGAFVLLGAAGAAFLAGLVMALVAWLVSDLTAVRSVAVSTLLVVAVIGFGVYVLNLVVLAAVVLTLARNGMMDGTFDRRWFGGGVAVATLAWMIAQIVAHVRARIPIYDLPEAGAR